MTIIKGEIWLVNLDPTLGDEIRKIRPAIVVSSDAFGVLALRVVVPLTGWQDRFQGSQWLVRIDPVRVEQPRKAFGRRCVPSKVRLDSPFSAKVGPSE